MLCRHGATGQAGPHQSGLKRYSDLNRGHRLSQDARGGERRGEEERQGAPRQESTAKGSHSKLGLQNAVWRGNEKGHKTTELRRSPRRIRREE